MNDFNDNSQKRLLAVMVLSFTFFIIYDYFFIPKNIQSQKEQPLKQTQSKNTQSQAIGVNDAPKMSSLSSNKTAPVLKQNNLKQDNLIVVKSNNFNIFIDKFGRVSQAIIRSDSYEDVALFSPKYIKPLELRFEDSKVNLEAFKTPYTSLVKEIYVDTQKSFEIKQKLSNIEITKTFTFFNNGRYTLKVSTSKDVNYFITPGYRPDASVDNFAFHGALIKLPDDTLEMIDDEDLSSPSQFNNAKIISSMDKYFVTMFYDFDKGLNALADVYLKDSPLLFVRGLNNQTFNGYIGEKAYKHLKNIHPELTDIVNYGFITFFAKPVFQGLSIINDYIGNWGWSIVVLTVLIRLVLYPLTYKGMVSMNKIKELAPQVKEIQAKHKGDSQRSGVAMMELYKKHNANPMGGCMPFIVQIPIFFAIYRTLLNSIELKGSVWELWIQDLSLQDPYFVLPILMGASMYIQQVLTPSTLTDPMQQKLFKFLPVIFTVFFLTFPAGLVLYWLVNNIFSISQQYYINKLFEKKKLQKSKQNT